MTVTRSGTVGAATPATSPATAPPPAPGTPSSLATRLGSLVSSIRSGFEGTPGRMRAVAAVTVLAAVVFGLLAGYSFRAADGALSRAKANTDQLIRVQAIQNHVVQADADATNAFLVGGLEPAAQRADYTDSISSASQLIAEAAKSQPADGEALGALNEALVAYASTIEQARANNRQALPIGSQYLKDASAELRAQALPPLKNLVDANNARAAEEFDNAGKAAVWLVVAGLLTLLVLGLGMFWLARRTRRYLNVPLATAAAIVFVALVLGAIGLFGVGNKVDTVQDGVYAATLSTAQARIAGFDAKSNESLTLIARGSGADFETAWKAADQVVQRQIHDLAQNPAADGLDTLPWDPYATVHARIRQLDDSGRWDGAVALATSTASGSGNVTFAKFDDSSGAQLSSLGKDTASDLDQAGGWLPFAAVLGLLAGIVAALLAWWGFAQRLEEYR